MDILANIVSALESEERVLLATIIASSGSTPVPAGAKMLLTGAAEIPLGTVGGGCLEADVIEEGRRLYAAGAGMAVQTFRLTEDDVEGGMICGGRVEILLETITAGERELFDRVLARREAGMDSIVVTVLQNGESRAQRWLLATSDPADRAFIDTWSAVSAVAGNPDVPPGEAVARARTREEVIRIAAARGQIVLDPVNAPQDLIIFGGGHVSRFVSRSAVMAGFRVTVVDDRAEYANARRFPEAARTLASHSEKAWASLRVTESTSIVVVTRGHKFDEVVLERAVQTPARYIGMIGSRQKVLTTFRRLIGRGTPRTLLEKVRAPIGLRIGAITAEEIGISITAELIAVRRGIAGAAPPMSEEVRGMVSRPEEWQ